MADSNAKHPAHEKLEGFEKQLSTQPIKLNELKTAAAVLESDLSDSLKFEKAQEAESEAIRAKLKAILKLVPQGKEAKKIRTSVRNLLDKIEVVENKPEPTAQGNSNKSDSGSPQKDEKAEDRQSTEKINTDEKLAQLAERIAPQEYKKWCDLFKALNYGDDPGQQIGKQIKDITGIQGRNEYRKVKDELKKAGFIEFLNATSPISAIQKISKAEDLDEKKLKETISKKNTEIKGVIQKVTTAMRTPTAQSTQNIQKHKPDAQAPQNGPSPQPQSEIAKLKEKAPASEHPFYDAIEKYTEDKPEARDVFLRVVELGKIETSVVWVTDLKERVNGLITGTKSQKNPEKWIPSLLKTGLEPLKTEIAKALKEWEEAEFYVTLGLGKINKEMNQVYTILSIDPQTIKDPAKRRYFIDIQKEVETKLTEIKTAFPKAEIEPKGLKDKKAKAQEIQATLKGIEEEIKYFKDEILEELPSDTQSVYKNEKLVAPQNTTNAQQTSAPSAPIPPVVPYRNPRPTNNALDDDDGLNEPLNEGRPNNRTVPNTANTPSKPQNAPNEPERMTDDVKKMLESLLPKKELVNDDSAVCLAISKLIRESGIDINQLKQFLQNPEFLNKTVSDEAKQAVTAEMQEKHANSLDKLKTALDDELKDIEEYADSIKGRKPLQTEADKLSANRERKTKIRNMSRTLDLMIALEKRTMTYESPREILALINFFINKDKQISMEALSEQMDNQIGEQKEGLYKGWRARINQACFFLRPTMSSTLRAIAKDREFKQLGENPAAELEKLAKIAGSGPKLRDWADKLPGGLEKNIHTTIPRVIAYMESAIREGKVSSMMATGGARKLVENLRSLQRANVRKEVEDEFRKDRSMTNEQKMLLYVTKLNQADQSVADINLKLIKSNSRNTKLIRGSALAGGLIAPYIAPLAAFSTLTVPYFAERIYKGISTKDTPMAVKAGARVTAANALGIGGTLVGGPYLGIPLAVLGLATPFFWKHKKGIGKAGLVAGGAGLGVVRWGASKIPIVGRLFKK